jgi:hypothetical protein
VVDAGEPVKFVDESMSVPMVADIERGAETGDYAATVPSVVYSVAPSPHEGGEQ